MTSIVIGCDPGLSGALCLIDQSGLVALSDLPVMMKGKGSGKVKNEINAAALNQLLRGWANGHADEVLFVMERVASMPNQGSAGIMSLGDTVGCIRGVVAARGYPMEYVAPQRWKSHHGLQAPAEPDKNKRQAMMKELARARAIQLYPGCEELARKRDHNRGEAILIARWGWDVLR